VVVVGGGPAAVAHLASAAAYDAIVCDWLMPEVGGAEVLAWLTAHRPAQATRVIMMSGSVPSTSAQACARWLRKPFGMDELQRAVATAIDSPS